MIAIGPCRGFFPAMFAVMAAHFAMAPAPVVAQTRLYNYDNLSILEERLATEVGDVTVRLNGLLETPVMVDLDAGEAADSEFIGNFDLTAGTQLRNRWRVRLTYLGQYATQPLFNGQVTEGYGDNALLSIGGAWGTMLAGNVSGVVREQTRRLRGLGGHSLVFDDVLGLLGERSVGYVGRFGPWVMSTVVDEEAGFDLGATFRRPLGNKDYRLTARYVESTYAPSDESVLFDTQAFAVVGEFIYGATLFDLSMGLERLASDGLSTDRSYLSSGVRTKIGAIGLFVEGHYGMIEGEEVTSATMGVEHDLARGLSATWGVHYADAVVNVAGVNLLDSREMQFVFSFLYGF